MSLQRGVRTERPGADSGTGQGTGRDQEHGSNREPAEILGREVALPLWRNRRSRLFTWCLKARVQSEGWKTRRDQATYDFIASQAEKPRERRSGCQLPSGATLSALSTWLPGPGDGGFLKSMLEPMPIFAPHCPPEAPAPLPSCFIHPETGRERGLEAGGGSRGCPRTSPLCSPPSAPRPR